MHDPSQCQSGTRTHHLHLILHKTLQEFLGSLRRRLLLGFFPLLLLFQNATSVNFVRASPPLFWIDGKEGLVANDAPCDGRQEDYQNKGIDAPKDFGVKGSRIMMAVVAGEGIGDSVNKVGGAIVGGSGVVPLQYIVVGQIGHLIESAVEIVVHSGIVIMVIIKMIDKLEESVREGL